MSTTTLIRPAHIESLTELFVVVGHPASPTLEVAHSTPECPEIVTPADSLPFAGAWHPVAEADGWLCSTCIDVDAVGFSEMDTDSPLRTGTAGPGTPVDSVPEVISWTKHGEEWVLRIPRSFEAKVGDTVTVTKKSGETAEVVVGEKVGTRKGDLLHRPGRKAEATVGYRWRKVDGEWLVAGPAAEVGSTITITKASGETVEAVVTGHAGTDLHRVRKVEAATTTAAPAVEVPEGHYAIDSHGSNDTLFVRVDRPTEGRWAGRVFVKMIVGGHPDSPIRGAQAQSVLTRIAEAGVEAAATRYGVDVGRCHRCNRLLTDQVSREMGIGPECRKK